MTGLRHSLVFVAAAVVLGCADTHELPLPAGAHVIEDDGLDELSGLAASIDQPGVLWAINDDPLRIHLFRLDRYGADLGRVAVHGALGWDPESLALYRDDDGHWLLIGDIGDNNALRDSVRIHAVREPAPHLERADIAWTVKFRYPDGPRDAEAFAVDHSTGDILIITKRDDPARLYRIPVTARATTGTAEFVGTLSPDGDLGKITGMDISTDGTTLVALSYDALHLWSRDAGESWAQALARPAVTHALPALPKAEGVAFSVDGEELFVGSERLPAFLLKVSGLPSPRS